MDAAINQQRLIEIPESVIDIDIMMGERTGTGHGVGSAAIRLVADAALSDPSVPFVIAAGLRQGRIPGRAGVRRRPERAMCADGAAPSASAEPMNESNPRFWKVFFEVYEALPRQGPGNRACAVRAISLCHDMPPAPVILDLGCGVGGQTLHLAEITSGPIVAIDRHAPSIERLKATLAERGLSERVQALVGDMAHPAQPPESFDLIWSEGALYNIGIENALRICHGLLRPGGCLAFTDAVWRKADPPPEVKASFDVDYPTMGWVEDVLMAIDGCGFEPLGHFTLPDEAWWRDFYTPMQHRIDELHVKYADDAAATAILDQLAREPELHRRCSEYYAYEFFVTRRDGRPHAAPSRSRGPLA